MRSAVVMRGRGEYPTMCSRTACSHPVGGPQKQKPAAHWSQYPRTAFLQPTLLAIKNSVLPTFPSFLLPTSFPACHSCLSFCLVLFASLPALRLCPAFNLALVEALCHALPILWSSNGMHSFPGYKDTSGPAPRRPLLVAANAGAISLSSEMGAKQLWTL